MDKVINAMNQERSEFLKELEGANTQVFWKAGLSLSFRRTISAGIPHRVAGRPPTYQDIPVTH